MLDVLFGAIATTFGAVSLWYPFGRDQALFYYAAREWLLRGQVLYRDVWDHKPPVIYFIHMATIAVFGEHVWGIRAVELFVAVPLLAWLTARLAHAPGEPRTPGSLGAAWLGVATFHYGYSGFWDTAQCELWVAVLAAAALVTALHDRRATRGAGVAGALCALALFTKPVAVFFVVLCAVAVGRRAWVPERRGLAAVGSLLVWAAGGVATAGAILGYFAARHALAPMLDILVGANGAYVDQERVIRDLGALRAFTTMYFASLQPFSTVFVVGTAAATFLAFARRDGRLSRRYLLPAALVLASYAAVVMQLKFYLYHWGTLAAAAGLFAATVYVDVAAVARPRSDTWLAPAAFLALTAGLYLTSANAAADWFRTTRTTWGYVTGSLSSEAFAAAFDLPLFFANQDSERAGVFLRTHALPGDTLVVRGFEPQIYARSGLHYTARFFWTAFLTMPTRRYRRDEWLAEDAEALRRNPPRWAVTLSHTPFGLDSAASFEHLGYSKRLVLENFTVLERAPVAQAAR